MKITNLPAAFTAAMPVLKKLNDAGFKAYFVGGAVRDLLLHKHSHDVDIATSAYPEEVKHLFKKSFDTGIEHGTVTVLSGDNSYEITTFRTESGYQDYRRPDKVTFVQSLADDLKRRDFTINALAMDINGELIDLFDGAMDLKQGLIKAVGDPEERFNEDALRMMRAVRFMSQLEFHLEARTKQAIKRRHQLLQKISIERIRDEFVKMGIGPASRQAFQVFLDTNLNEDVPKLAGKKDLLAIYPQLKFSPVKETSFWAVVIVLLKIPNKEISAFMHNWKNSNAVTKEVEKVVNLFDLLSEYSPTDYELFKAGQSSLLNAIDIAHILGQPVDAKALVDRYTALPIKTTAELAIDGNFLIGYGIKPGPQLGHILTAIKKKVVAGELENDPDLITEFLDQQQFD